MFTFRFLCKYDNDIFGLYMLEIKLSRDISGFYWTIYCIYVEMMNKLFKFVVSMWKMNKLTLSIRVHVLTPNSPSITKRVWCYINSQILKYS